MTNARKLWQAHATKALEQIDDEIVDRERELADLHKRRASMVSALDREGRTHVGKKRCARAAGGRIDWKAELVALPAVFSIDDMMERPKLQSKGRAQAYPGLTRWLDGKLVTRVGKGRYRKTKKGLELGKAAA